VRVRVRVRVGARAGVRVRVGARAGVRVGVGARAGPPLDGALAPHRRRALGLQLLLLVLVERS
jgi:hypothetical protein